MMIYHSLTRNMASSASMGDENDISLTCKICREHVIFKHFDMQTQSSKHPVQSWTYLKESYSNPRLLTCRRDHPLYRKHLHSIALDISKLQVWHAEYALSLWPASISVCRSKVQSVLNTAKCSWRKSYTVLAPYRANCKHSCRESDECHLESMTGSLVVGWRVEATKHPKSHDSEHRILLL